MTCDWRFAGFRAKELVHDGLAVMAEAKDSLPRGGAEGVHVHEWGEWEPDRLMRIEYAYCPCGASKARRAELEKPQGPEAERWKTASCRDCEQPIPQGVDRCNACAWKARRAEPGWCDACQQDKPCVCDEKPQERVCGICQGPHGTEDCKRLEEPEADAETAPVLIPRRPPYAVAYAVEGGAQYEIAVSGDATVVAEDGALHILHPKKAVLAIVRIQPMNMEESDA